MVSTTTAAMLKKDGTHPEDRERLALFYVLGSVPKFVTLQDEIYNFKEHAIRPNVLESIDFSSGERKVLLLAFNLYNGWECPSPHDIFTILDSNMREIALRAIQIRFLGGF